MTAQCVIFPFDLFGSGGSAAGALLLGDSLREMIDDTRAETQPVRLRAAARTLKITEIDLLDVEAVSQWRTLGQKAFQQHYRTGGFTLWLSGNHLGVLPVYESLGRDTLVIQFDAHLDCYDLHDTHGSLSHGNFLREVTGPAIVNVGHRDLFLTDTAIREYYVEAFAAEVDSATVIAALKKRIAKVKHVWLDLDADAFDPSVCPAVSTPAPCGFTGLQLLRLLDAIGFEKVRGVSLSEFDPARDNQHRSLELLGWLLEWLLLKKLAQ